MKKFFLFCVLIIAYFELSFAGTNFFTVNADQFQLESDDRGELIVKFTLPPYQIISEQVGNIEYQKIDIMDTSEILEIGKPDLPIFTTLLSIPETGNPELTILSVTEEYLSDFLAYPQQELISESNLNRNNFVIDDNYYSSNEIFPIDQTELSAPMIMRDQRLVALTFQPFRYDPASRELIINKEIRVKIQTTGNGGENTITVSRDKSSFFDKIYRSVILNYDNFQGRETFQKPSYLFIYPNNSEVETYLNILTEWKHQKGFEVTAVNTTITGSNINSIKSYIQNAYFTWENPPEFVCLVGDAGGSFNIPTGHFMGGWYNGEGDHFFTTIDGNDEISDIMIGRLSFNSLTELQTIINKILNYERTPYMVETNWYDKAVLIGDPTSSGPSTVDTKLSVHQMITEHNSNIGCTEVFNGPWVSQMSTNINNGVSYFNYRGFGGMSGWTTNDIQNLNNGFRLPVAVALTCNTGDFEGTSDCISEKFLKAGTPSSPKGAIAAISTATGNTHTCFNNCMDAGIYYGIFADQIYNMGGALNRGKINLLLNYPQNPDYFVTKFSYWNN
ncbi:MAG: hypothetical protein JW996_04950, partial [Candidatus Cloacimonetes bacterium]|nr:hypothetical protein [Candidatus Cloacimonadota bacterium]